MRQVEHLVAKRHVHGKLQQAQAPTIIQAKHHVMESSYMQHDVAAVLPEDPNHKSEGASFCCNTTVGTCLFVFVARFLHNALVHKGGNPKMISRNVHLESHDLSLL